MSIHADPRRNSLDEQEYADWQRDLRLEYEREEYEERHPYEIDPPNECEYQGEDGSCYCDENCKYQRGKWKDVCGIWKESEDEEESEEV